LNRFKESGGDTNPLPGLLVGGVVVLLAQLFFSVAGRTDLRTCAECAPTAPCAYELFEDNVCLGTVFCDHPQSIEGILRRLGSSRGATLKGFEGKVPCGSSVWLSRNSAGMAVHAISGGKLMAAGKKIDVHRAGASDLAWVPGIGPTLAERIVRERARRNGFASINELRSIPGIGEKKWQALAQWVEVGPSVGSSCFTMAPDPVDRPERSMQASPQRPLLVSPLLPVDAGF
jgi:hypothetical protein